MAKIGTIIPKQAFELIRDRIAAILNDEIANQFLLTNDHSLKLKVVTESINPVNTPNLPVVNVNFASGKYDSKNYGGSISASPYTYNIDVYTHSNTIGNYDGSYLSAIALQKILGVCRYALEHSAYKTLGFVAPFIQRVYCSEVDIANSGKNDMLNSMMGRLTFNVDAIEITGLKIPETIVGYETIVKIENTEKGFVYSS